jgi:hypothetical protein
MQRSKASVLHFSTKLSCDSHDEVLVKGPLSLSQCKGSDDTPASKYRFPLPELDTKDCLKPMPSASHQEVDNNYS